MSFSLKNNFWINARGVSYADSASVTWSFNANTNTISANVTGTPLGANPTAKVGLVAVNGVAVTWMRSDAAPPIDQAIVPTWTGLHTFGAGITVSAGAFTLNGHTLTLSANATIGGTNTGDQVLPVGANPTGSVGLAAVNGVATSFMRSDAAPQLSQAIVPTWSGLHTFGAGITISAGAFTLNAHPLTLTATASVGGTNTGDQTLPVGANPTAKVGPTATNGVATTWMRSDGAPAIDLTANYTWSGSHVFSSGSIQLQPSAGLAATVLIDGNTGHQQFYVGVGIGGVGQFAIYDATNSTIRLGITSTGNATFSGPLAINGGTPTAQLTGFGTPVGTPTAGLTNGSTLAQTAGTLAALLVYLKAAGFIGA